MSYVAKNNNLKIATLESGLSLKDVAAKSELSHGFVISLANGSRNTSLGSATVIANALGKTVEELFVKVDKKVN